MKVSNILTELEIFRFKFSYYQHQIASQMNQSDEILTKKVLQLRNLFPEIAVGNQLDCDKLRRLLGQYALCNGETNPFSWSGKYQAAEQAQTDTEKSFQLNPDESFNYQTTENLYIQGDNIDVLKAMLSSDSEIGNMAQTIKMIYIDPPYNTGKQFIYSDKFCTPAGKAESNDSTIAQSHASWLNMIYPRLILSQKLLVPAGAIFISIDDTEVMNLRKICDEIYGESNFVADFIWLTTQGAQGILRKQMVVENHEHILCYAKDAQQFVFRGKKRSTDTFANPDKDPRGLWKRQYLQRFGQGFQQRTITNPANGKQYTFETPYTEEKMNALIADNRIIFPRGKGYPARKEFFCEYSQHQQLTTYLGLYSTKANTEQLNKLFDGVRIFNSPKPTALIQFLIEAVTDTQDTVLDFFSGSATTAEAVLKLNAQDGGNRRFIMVQIPESCSPKTEAYKAGYTDICQIGKERIRRVIAQLETASNQPGFRVYQ